MSFADRLAEVRARIEKAGGAGLLAVSKLQPIDAIEEAYGLGLRDFGENYVQELVEKKQALAHLPDIRWHLIGHLQTNKAKQALAAADYFHALDSEKLARELDRRVPEFRGEPWPVFIQVNLDGEQSKAGVTLEALPELIATVRELKNLRLEGLMCIPEPKERPEAMREAFRRLAQLAKKYDLQGLSMGMSEDFEIAVEEGSSWVRVGRKLFGDRPKPSL